MVLVHHGPSLLSCLCPQNLKVLAEWSSMTLSPARCPEAKCVSHMLSCAKHVVLVYQVHIRGTYGEGTPVCALVVLVMVIGVLEMRLCSSALEESRECWGWRVRSGC